MIPILFPYFREAGAPTTSKMEVRYAMQVNDKTPHLQYLKIGVFLFTYFTFGNKRHIAKEILPII
jgi:hypothetical protein